MSLGIGGAALGFDVDGLRLRHAAEIAVEGDVVQGGKIPADRARRGARGRGKIL
ncbi:hypothetical protein D3C87_2164060 [compost metagenome]